MHKLQREAISFSPSKTVTMAFIKMGKREMEPVEITLKSQIIPYKESSQFLRMTLDSR